MLPRYNNNVATLQQQYCHATTMLPRYANNVATLRKQYCHATIMSRNGQKMS